ncbi:MAG: energy transducer TonB [Thermoanaerobaculia bacterium]
MTLRELTIPKTHDTGRLFLTTILGIVLLAAMTLAESPDQKKIIRVEGEVHSPKKIYAPQPGYPKAAKEERIEGRVVAQVTIDERGQVSDIEIIRSLREEFDAAVVESLAQWEFEPATLHDEPVAVYYNLTVNFRLDGDSAKEKYGYGENLPMGPLVCP